MACGGSLPNWAPSTERFLDLYPSLNAADFPFSISTKLSLSGPQIQADANLYFSPLYAQQ
jgi:hypothetical protein